MIELVHIPEPSLLFRHGQATLDPRDGLTLFGPLEDPPIGRIQWAAVGPRSCIDRMKKWVKRVQGPVYGPPGATARPLFPGFESVFRTVWDSNPVLELEIPADEISRRVHNADKHQRVFQTADLYVEKILQAKMNEDITPTIWCVLIPEEVYSYCRPQSQVPTGEKVQPANRLSKMDLRKSATEQFLFEDMKELAQEYTYEANFRHQLKARLLPHLVPIQIIREIKIAEADLVSASGKPLCPDSTLESAIAWNLATAIYYKSGGRPWKLGTTRDGVCYIGMVFKQMEREADTRTACCAAQMFMDSGDGVVFRGAVGPWFHEKRGDFHLDKKSAKEIVSMCIEAYRKQNGKPPKELFLHGQISLHDEEWSGFMEGAGSDTRVVGVQIRPSAAIKLFRPGDHPVLRGTAYLVNEKSGFLWTKGMVPRLRTYPGREVPKPIFVQVCRGDSDIRTVMADVLALTKLNYNSCTFADGEPVTLKFANAVGEILTAGPFAKDSGHPLPFKYYI